MQEIKKTLPLVSVGIPVYNGENYLEEAIESVINQTYGNWELIISDNGSTDSTPKICKEFLKRDNRIRYSRLESNQGASRNYNKVFEESKGKYFKWLPHDDKISLENLSKGVDILENNIDVVLCGSWKRSIGADRVEINTYDPKGLHLCNADTLERYRDFLDYFSINFENADFIMGLIRSDVLKQTNLIGNYTAADFTLLGELILRGKFYVVNEPLYIRRIHHGISLSIYNNQPDLLKDLDSNHEIKIKSHAEIAKWYDPNGKIRYVPHFKWLSELTKSINKLGFVGAEKRSLKFIAYKWFVYFIWTSLLVKVKEVVPG